MVMNILWKLSWSHYNYSYCKYFFLIDVTFYSINYTSSKEKHYFLSKKTKSNFFCIILFIVFTANIFFDTLKSKLWKYIFIYLLLKLKFIVLISYFFIIKNYYGKKCKRNNCINKKNEF
jgi:succinate-acetate transporter protein